MALLLASNQEALLVYSTAVEKKEPSTYYKLGILPKILLKLEQFPNSTQITNPFLNFL